MANAYTIKATPESTDSITISDVTGQIFRATLGSLPGSSSVVGGYVDPPVYSDSSGIKGQYSFDAEYVYMCIADNSWDRFPVIWDAWNTATPENPVILSATIGISGAAITLIFDRNVYKGSAYLDSDFNLDASSGGVDIGLTYVSGDGMDTWVFSIAQIIRSGETADLDYIGGVDGIEDSSGNNLEAVGSFTVINGSEEDFSDIIFWEGFEGGITGTTYLSTENDYPPNHTGVIANTSYITLNTATKRVGAKSMRLNGVASDVKLTFALSAPVDAAQGRVGFWINASGDPTYQGILTLSNSSLANTSLAIEFYSVPTVISVTRLVAVGDFGEGDPSQKPVTLPNTLLNNWNFLEIAWDVSNFGTKVLMNGQATSLTSYTPNRTWPGEYNRLVIGNTNNNGCTGYFDNFMISTDPNRDLYALALLEAYPG